MGFVPILGVACELYRTPFFFILSCLIFKSSVDRGIPSLAAAPFGPATFPRVDQHARKPYVKAAVHHPYASHFASKATSDRITVLGDVLPPCRVPLRDPPCAWKPAVVGTTSVEAVDLASTVLALRGIGDNQRLL
jgi:hypothetical protein